MPQIVKIECSECEAAETYEYDKVIVVGWLKGGGLFYRAHELTLGEAVQAMVDQAVSISQAKSNA